MDIIENFLTAGSAGEIFKALSQTCHELGFDYFFYSPLINGGNSETVFRDESIILEGEALMMQNTLLNYPASWVHRYQEAKHTHHDPIIRHVSKSILPIFWDDAVNAEPQNIVLNEANEHKLASGITVTLYGHGGARSVLSFAAGQRRNEPRVEAIKNASHIQLTAHYVYEALKKISNISGTIPGSALSTREKDCLKWSANGKTSWEIAMILKVSERTVVFHLTNAVKKLGAANRRQAVVRALSLRLINP